MSSKFPGGFVTKSPVAPTTSAASGIWTLDQQEQYQKAGTWPAPPPPNYIEDVFSTYLYTGTGATQTITNGIDLSGKGGLVWTKARYYGISHRLVDTTRGATYELVSNDTSASAVNSTGLTSFGSTGYTIGSAGGYNNSGGTYVGWTFRKQPKFFDVVTFTATRSGSGWSGGPVVVNHNLGSTPGCVMWKAVDNTSNWYVNHRSLGNQYRSFLNTTDASVDTGVANYINPTSTNVTFSNATCGIVGDGVTVTIVMYVFAHNAGGFGATETDNVISCGSYVGSNTTFTTVTLGYEPQWVMIKRATGTTSAYTGWAIFDNMRGMPVSGNDNTLLANTSDAENPATANGSFVSPTATGFTLNVPGSNLTNTSETYIYIAIRRGPMKVPTSGTSVFAPITYNGNGTSQTITGSVGVPDLGLGIGRSGGQAGQNAWYDRLRGKELALRSTNTTAEYNASPGGEGTMTNTMNGMRVENTYGILDDGTTPYILYFLTRAPSFFDEVCYTGTEISGQTFNHNLGVVPEMMIVKARDGTTDWTVYHSALGASARIYLNATNAANTGTAAPWNSTTPTSTVFSLGNAGATNLSGTKFVNYLFATCAGVSKVGSYTGTGETLTVDCGFTGGARFVLIKRTDSTGIWWVWDTARGMVSGTDPRIALNNTGAEANDNWVYTTTGGFTVLAANPSINTSGGTYIYLAIA